MTTQAHTQAHTPGPWGVSESIDNTESLSTYYVGPLGGSFAAQLLAATVGLASNSSWSVTKEECAANAALMAASPELLEALRWAVEQIADDLCPDHQAALDGCRQAIAKAEGKTNE
jgi:hypothetical protein